MHYSQKYTLVSFLESIDINAEFTMTDWPPHITLADVFAVDLDAGIENKLANLLVNVPSVDLTAREESKLGTTKVVLIENNDNLQNLHVRIIDLLESNGAKFNTPEFTRAGFIPHSSIQKPRKLHEGDTIAMNTISLIDMFPNKNWQQRRVLRNFKLDGARS